VDAAEAAGPSLRASGLRHDLLPPSPSAPDRLGLNLFGTDGRLLDLAEQWSRRWLGPQAATAVAALPRPLGVAWHAGALWSAAGPRLKLYATAEATVALAPVLRAVGLPPRAGALGLGLDVDATGPLRARTYHLDGTPWLADWPQAQASRWQSVSAPGISHRIVTVLGDEKRTLNLIFAPWAPLSSLEQVARELAEEAPPALPPAGRPALGPGTVLRPAAYELDLYPPDAAHPAGRVQADLLLTVGVGIAPSR